VSGRARVAAVLAVALAVSSPRGAGAASGRDDGIDRGVARGVAFLGGQIDKDGVCKREFAASDRHWGGMTALCALAMASAGTDANDPPLRRALAWLAKAQLKSTYAVSLRACAFAAVKDRRYLPLLKRDAAWLINAANSDGGYTYLPQQRKAPAVFDNSNTQMAVLGVSAAAQSGVEIPPSYWRMMRGHWRRTQQTDGGWGYTAPRGPLAVKTYGSMTAAGVASLYLCLDNMPAAQAATYKAIDGGLRWLGKHYTVAGNPRLAGNRYYYWMYCLARVALASGRKTFAGHHWYRDGAAALLSRQHPNGSWAFGRPVRQTCFALLFLARASRGILFHKLEYSGRWNTRPRDLANLTRWISYNFERPVGWQVIGFDANDADWLDAPILYVSGSGPFEMTASQVDRLRVFALRGGMILSEAADNNADFTREIRKLYKRMFPRLQLRRLADNHPIYKLHFLLKAGAGLVGVSNGVRLLAVHCPRELSGGLQTGRAREHLPIFQLAANLALFATERSLPRSRRPRAWPIAQKFDPAATIRVARIKYQGNWNPEPLAWRRLAVLMGNRHKIRLEVSPPVAIADLDPSKWPIAAMTGTGALTLTPKETTALKNYLAAGGTLVIDAAGGSREFAKAVEQHILPLVAGGSVGPIAPEHAIYRGPEKIGRVRYRIALAAALGRQGGKTRLQGVDRGGRLAIVFSRDDLTAGVLGAGCYGLRGYAPPTAVALMTNILCHAAGVGEDGPRK